MRAYASGLNEDPVIVSGESGAATLGAVISILTDEKLTELRAAMEFSSDSVILLINTEGDTDPANYQNVIMGKE